MTNTANDTAAATVNPCTALVHIPATATAAAPIPVYKRCIINDRPRFGGRILTVRFYNAAPLEIYVSDIADVTDSDMCKVGRAAGRAGIAGLLALGYTDADPIYPLILRTAQTLINLI